MGPKAKISSGQNKGTPLEDQNSQVQRGDLRWQLEHSGYNSISPANLAPLSVSKILQSLKILGLFLHRDMQTLQSGGLLVPNFVLQ